MFRQIVSELKKYKNPEKAEFFPRFFKTGKGEYGEGDKFLGITVPNVRSVASKFYKTTSLHDIRALLNNEFHEIRLCALIILTLKYSKASEKEKKEIFEFYILNTKFINNWDLVDASAYKIVGAYLFDKDRKILYGLADSKNLWEQRIAIISTMYFIKKNDLDDIFRISKNLISHKHDLIHKALGWMLREAGKFNQKRLEDFLEIYSGQMPRTMLRYSIEKLQQNQKSYYMSK